MGRGRVFIDEMGRKYRIKSPDPLSEPPENLRIARTRKTWEVYLRMMGTVLPAFFLMYTFLFLILGISNLEPSMVLGSSLCSAPLVILIARLHRPKLVHVSLAVPDDSGSEAHALPGERSLRTPTKTKLSRFIVKDDSILDVPPSRHLWLIFGAVVSVGVAIWALILGVSEEIGLLLFVIVAIPLWLVGFSLPVLAWWGTSNKLLGLATRRRDAEAWLMAGMASAFPAFIFNSLIAPELVPFSQESWAFELSLLAIGAPFCEEIFKALAVAIFLPSIKGPKHGFQIGFTVGLGFALIENFQYIGASVLGGPIAVSFTILVRGIGSIPGHAIWTAIAGTAIGWLATDAEFKAKMTWRARSVAISAVDMAEGLGIDTDGDGDLSGFDGPRPTLEEEIINSSSNNAVSENPWTILGSDFSMTYKTTNPLSNKIGIQTPRGIIPATSLSIAGHSFWNGTSFLSFVAPTEWMGFNDGYGAAIMLVWTVFLISSVLVIARSLIRGINSLEL